MFTLERLLKSKKELEEVSDLPLEDFVDWEFVISLIDSHIKALEAKEVFEYIENAPTIFNYGFDEKIKR
ncbi:hypothetical protein [Pseudobutyrivibrio sp.]